MDGLQWILERNDHQTLLLVAVDRHASNQPGAYPCQVIGEFSTLAQHMLSDPPADDARISRLLSDIGMPANLLGYAYLRTALTLLLQEPELTHFISRRLYPRVAQAHSVSASSVERAIRHAISQTFARGGGAMYRSALGRLASPVGDRPTNSEFIAQTLERLRLSA